MRHNLVTAVLAFMLVFAVMAAHADEIDDYVTAQMHKQDIPGLSLAIVSAGQPVVERGYGLADVEHDVPATPDTVYEIGSMTKPFTAVAIMMLVEAGKIGLDDKISAYLPDPPAAWSSLTIRNLLTQTSGLKDYLEVGEEAGRIRDDLSREEIVQLISGMPLAFTPGDRFEYSNTNYFLLGMILEKASGTSYADFLETRIFTPLGMTATRVDVPSAVLPNRASGYLRDGRTRHHAARISMTWAYSAGAIVSTVKDMVKWDAALKTDTLLKPSTLKQMWTPALLNNGASAPYGFGWFPGMVNGHRYIWHNGGVPDGFKSQMALFPDDGLTVIVLTNLFPAETESIALGLAGLAAPALAPPKPIQDTDPQATRMLRAVLLDIQEGKADPARFTPEMLAVLTPQLPQLSASFKPLGALTSFEPTAQTTRGTIRNDTYRATFGETAWSFQFALTADGKVAGIHPVPE